MLKRFKVRNVLFCSFALFIVLLFAVVMLVSYRIMVSEMVDNTTLYQQQSLGLFSKEINNQLRAVEEMSLALSLHNDLQPFLKGEPDTFSYNQHRANIHSYLYRVVLSISLVESIDMYMNNPPAYDRQTTVRFLPLLDLPSHPEIEKINEIDSGWLGSHQTLIGQEQQQVVSFTRKVYAGNGDLRAVLVLNIPLNKFNEMIADDENMAGNRLLIDSNQRTIASVGNGKVGADRHSFLSEVYQAMKEKEASYPKQGKVKGGEGLIVWSQLPDSDWLLLEVTPWERLTEGGKRIIGVLYVISLIAVISVLFVTYYISGKFTKPILLLMRAMQQYGAKRHIELPGDYENEFGQLFRGFQLMTRRIEQLYQSLEKQHERQRKAEISALQANINPHFLYNTLDQLNWMAIARNQEEMSRVLELTGKMLRIGLSEGKSLIPIQDELNHIRYYMQIQQYRLKESVTYSIEMPEQVKECYIPKFTLQPFVENAIVHGFHRRETGHIIIAVKEYENSLNILVIDNGNGFDVAVAKSKKGYGIVNVEQRLKAFFGKSCTLKVNSKPNVGTEVTIRIPKQKDERFKGGNLNVEDGDH